MRIKRFILILTVVLFATPVLAQTAVSIEVTDSSGSALPRAEVVVLTADGSTLSSGRTDANGRYTTNALRIGRHVNHVTAFERNAIAVGAHSSGRISA